MLFLSQYQCEENVPVKLCDHRKRKPMRKQKINGREITVNWENLDVYKSSTPITDVREKNSRMFHRGNLCKTVPHMRS